jgi:hypothetical protein
MRSSESAKIMRGAWLFAAFLIVSHETPAGGADSPARPNIVFILADDKYPPSMREKCLSRENQRFRAESPAFQHDAESRAIQPDSVELTTFCYS